ncbi:MAG: alanine racemase [Gammaproteobacteria bacterium]|nr:alanine racemase [Gammaproteobacteria bacterium]
MTSLTNSSAATAVLTVKLDSLVRNFRYLARRSKSAHCAAVVKANAYGLGVEPVSRALHGADCRDFFVTTACEGQELRAILPDANIYMFNGPTESSLAAIRDAGLIPVLNSPEQVQLWVSAASSESCVLHVDTGMRRLGLSPQQAQSLAATRDVADRLKIDAVMTHLACADEPGHALNEAQLQDFARVTQHWPGVRTSIGNSGGILLGREYCGDLARPGIALYGGLVGLDAALEEVVGLHARVLQLRDIDQAVTVGYGATATVQGPARLATLGIGYADGYPRSLGNRASGIVDGVRVPVVGRVSMDTVVVNVSALEPGALASGDLVRLLGGGIGLDELATLAGTISYEILTGIGARVARQYQGAGSG